MDGVILWMLLTLDGSVSLSGTFFCVTKHTASFPRIASAVIPGVFAVLNAYSGGSVVGAGVGERRRDVWGGGLTGSVEEFDVCVYHVVHDAFERQRTEDFHPPCPMEQLVGRTRREASQNGPIFTGELRS